MECSSFYLQFRLSTLKQTGESSSDSDDNFSDPNYKLMEGEDSHSHELDAGECSSD